MTKRKWATRISTHIMIRNPSRPSSVACSPALPRAFAALIGAETAAPIPPPTLFPLGLNTCVSAESATGLAHHLALRRVHQRADWATERERIRGRALHLDERDVVEDDLKLRPGAARGGGPGTDELDPGGLGGLHEL